ncbi:MAG: hypothetical protein DMF76_09555 [Acidobacteria bacterium]|nr:MAG: hypothetical protein DMF76_09555 [Acidobacteriota bacterium]
MLQERLSTLSDFRPIDTRAPPADGPVLSHVSAAFESFDFSFLDASLKQPRWRTAPQHLAR